MTETAAAAIAAMENALKELRDGSNGNVLRLSLIEAGNAVGRLLAEMHDEESTEPGKKTT